MQYLLLTLYIITTESVQSVVDIVRTHTTLSDHSRHEADLNTGVADNSAACDLSSTAGSGMENMADTAADRAWSEWVQLAGSLAPVSSADGNAAAASGASAGALESNNSSKTSQSSKSVDSVHAAICCWYFTGPLGISRQVAPAGRDISSDTAAAAAAALAADTVDDIESTAHHQIDDSAAVGTEIASVDSVSSPDSKSARVASHSNTGISDSKGSKCVASGLAQEPPSQTAERSESESMLPAILSAQNYLHRPQHCQRGDTSPGESWSSPMFPATADSVAYIGFHPIRIHCADSCRVSASSIGPSRGSSNSSGTDRRSCSKCGVYKGLCCTSLSPNEKEKFFKLTQDSTHMRKGALLSAARAIMFARISSLTIQPPESDSTGGDHSSVAGNAILTDLLKPDHAQMMAHLFREFATEDRDFEVIDALCTSSISQLTDLKDHHRILCCSYLKHCINRRYEMNEATYPPLGSQQEADRQILLSIQEQCLHM